jgi:uncharacterized membrane protein YbhN (UPF0104 family)
MVTLSSLWSDVQRLGPPATVIGIAGGVGVASLQAMRWWFITTPVLRIRYRDALAAILVGNFMNLVLPARAGDALRVDDLSRRAGVSRATLFGTELVDFVADKSGWLPAFGLFVLTGAPPTWMLRVVGYLLAILAIVGVLGFAFRRRLAEVARRRDGWVARLAEGVTANRPGRLALAGLVVAAAPWLFEAPILREVALLAGLHLSLFEAFTVLTAFNVATVVPTPGGVGTNEAASTAALLSFGVPPEHAIVFAFVYHATQLVPGLVAGGALFLARHVSALRRRGARALHAQTLER